MKLENRITAIYEVGDIVESVQGIGTIIQTHEIVVNNSFVSQSIYIQHEKGDKNNPCNNPVCKTANDIILIRSKNETD